jgi:hypothetical protein
MYLNALPVTQQEAHAGGPVALPPHLICQAKGGFHWEVGVNQEGITPFTHLIAGDMIMKIMVMSTSRN